MQEKTTQKTLPPDEIALFCEQVAMVLKAGIPLGDGMETFARSYADSRFGARFEHARRQTAVARCRMRWRTREFSRVYACADAHRRTLRQAR
ncbi:MAG: type II secretion system F family protein [Eubacteriales bacterium]